MTPAYFINSMLFIIPCILVLFLTFRDQLRRPLRLWVSIGVLITLTADLLASYVYLIFGGSSQRLLLTIVFLFTGVLIFNSVCRYTFWQSLFILAVINSYSENIRSFSYYIFFLFTKKLPGQAILETSCIMTVFTVLTLPAIHLFFKKLMRPALDYTVSLLIWRFIWIIPVCNNSIYTVVIAPDVSHYISHYTAFPGNEFFLISPLWILMTFSTYIILLKMMIDVSKNAQLQENLHLSETRITAQQKQMELLQLRIQETRRFRHDMRHQFLAVEGFIEEGDMEGLKMYIRQSISLLPVQMTENYCGSTAVNALLCHYKEQAEKDGDRVTLKILLPEELPVLETELCIILGNLLENAVEACRRMESRERFIDVRISMASDTILVILVRNSYEGSIQRMPDGTFLSAKMKNRKGIGLSSVISIVEKYNGIIKVEYQNQVFKASLLLNKV